MIAAEAELMLGNKPGAYTQLEALADNRALNGDGAALLAAYGIYSPDDIDLDFILDERAREFVGEHKRWNDLKRTQTLVSRVQMYSGTQAARDNIRDYHMLRPIPQAELDAISNSAEFGQNPGY
jgi:hypothetical protein